MITRINPKVERALRDAMDKVPHVEEDQIGEPLAILTDQERALAVGLAIMITCYVMVDVCGNQWPVESSVRRIARAVATKSSNARRLGLDPEEICAYLSRSVLGPDRLGDVLGGEPKVTHLPVIVAGEALAVYAPKGMGMWEYLDRIESAIEKASDLDPWMVPMAVISAYQPKPKEEDQPHSA
jgi:hypothetical protein